jgi:hypothetical protein
MTIEIVGNWEWEVEESETPPLLNLTIKNIFENKTVKLLNINWATGREDFLEHSYNMAVETLNGGDNCCLEGKVSLVEDSD